MSTTNNRRRFDVDPDAIFGVSTKDRVVAITLDDGPDGRYTPQVLELLADRRVHATFFEVGVNATAHPELVNQTVAAGHTIGDHTRHHRQLDGVPLETAFADIRGGADDLRSLGVDPTLFRPPYGLTDRAIGAFVTAERMRSVYWTVSVEHELSSSSIDEAVRRIVDGVRPGDILLAHDGSGWVTVPEARRISRARTLAALPGILDGLAARGFRVVDIPRLLDAGAPRTRKQL